MPGGGCDGCRRMAGRGHSQTFLPRRGDRRRGPLRGEYAGPRPPCENPHVGLSQRVAEHGIRVNGVRPCMSATDINPDDQSARIATIPLRGCEPRGDRRSTSYGAIDPAASYITGQLDVGRGALIRLTHGRVCCPPFQQACLRSARRRSGQRSTGPRYPMNGTRWR